MAEPSIPLLSLWNKRPQTGLTWGLYGALSVIFLLHSLDLVLTFFAITLGHVKEGNHILIVFFERMGITLTLFLIWLIALLVVIFVAQISLWLERPEYWFPFPSLFLFLFLIFIIIIKAMTLGWNVLTVLG